MNVEMHLGDLGWRAVEATLKRGPCAQAYGPVVVSFTDFTFARWRDLPGAWLGGMRLRRSWPRLEGAVGLMLWVKPLSRRSGSISMWASEEDLSRFVTSPAHLAIMRAYTTRMSGTSAVWHHRDSAPAAAIAQARRRLAGTKAFFA